MLRSEGEHSNLRKKILVLHSNKVKITTIKDKLAISCVFFVCLFVLFYLLLSVVLFFLSIKKLGKKKSGYIRE